MILFPPEGELCWNFYKENHCPDIKPLNIKNKINLKFMKLFHGKHLKFYYLVSIFIMVFLVALTVFLAVEVRNSLKQYDYIGKSEETPNTISISGEGEIFAAGNIAKVTVGVETENTTVEAAQVENSEKMNGIIQDFKKIGIEEKDLKTVNYNIRPKRQWDDGKSSTVGYIVSQNLEVKIRDTENISQVLSLAANSGANQVGSLNFEIDDPEVLRKQAREKAIKNAKEKAEGLADQLDVKLGRVVSFSEYNRDNSPVYYKAEAPAGLGGGETAPQIEAGENKISVKVNITYEIL